MVFVQNYVEMDHKMNTTEETIKSVLFENLKELAN